MEDENLRHVVILLLAGWSALAFTPRAAGAQGFSPEAAAADVGGRGPRGPPRRGRADGPPAGGHRIRRPRAALGHPVPAIPQPRRAETRRGGSLLEDRLRRILAAAARARARIGSPSWRMPTATAGPTAPGLRGRAEPGERAGLRLRRRLHPPVPYLLFYPDRDRDDRPDGDPEVLLTGFGMEDAHSVANSLTWGPDGWLYGLQGSTVTARVRGVEFQQGVWRYHPRTRRFELFCEAGQQWAWTSTATDGSSPARTSAGSSCSSSRGTVRLI